MGFKKIKIKSDVTSFKLPSEIFSSAQHVAQIHWVTVTPNKNSCQPRDKSTNKCLGRHRERIVLLRKIAWNRRRLVAFYIAR